MNQDCPIVKGVRVYRADISIERGLVAELRIPEGFTRADIPILKRQIERQLEGIADAIDDPASLSCTKQERAPYGDSSVGGQFQGQDTTTAKAKGIER